MNLSEINLHPLPSYGTAISWYSVVRENGPVRGLIHYVFRRRGVDLGPGTRLPQYPRVGLREPLSVVSRCGPKYGGSGASICGVATKA